MKIENTNARQLVNHYSEFRLKSLTHQINVENINLLLGSDMKEFLETEGWRVESDFAESPIGWLPSNINKRYALWLANKS